LKTTPLIGIEGMQAALGWPSVADVTQPQGAGAAVFASLVRQKIGRALSRYPDGQQAIVGILAADAQAVSTEPPIAIVVDFRGEVSDETLRELHRLSWNFSHSPVLITIEPNLLRAWSCCEAPDESRELGDFLVHQISSSDIETEETVWLENRAARSLHWINLVSGEFFAQNAERFDRDGRADQTLLGNLRYIRSRLAELGLTDDDVCHDLLARIIFVQFLFDRKDSEGIPALTEAKLLKLQMDGVLSKVHNSFHSVLADYKDTYSLFDWLNTKFNGDLFPGKGNTATARAQGWAKEKRVVAKEHLGLLAEFVQGELDMSAGQRCLWPQYSFDVIPLEFISSIYETFVTERAAQDGIFYTPPHLVDFVLDRVLPWDGSDWDLKILDPACGSGIFLVKAFQRLVHRWKQANPNQTIRADTLRSLLERNIFGVDKDPHAVRVACFSLYLAMCDEIEPRHYWTQIVFPPMREQRLICSDFFSEAHEGFCTVEHDAKYDLVIGNAPWGDGLVTQLAMEWAANSERKWMVANKDIGGLFLAKSAQLLRTGGRIAMIQSANSLLFNGGKKAITFRNQILATHRIEEIYNLSALRFKVFKRKSHAVKISISPACVVVMQKETPSLTDRICYISPKHLKPLVDEFTIIIEPQDRRWLTVSEALTDSRIWITLMWGGPRDRQLLQKLQKYPSLSDPGVEHDVKSRQGIIYGDRTRSEIKLRERRLFDMKAFPEESLLTLNSHELPLVGEIKTHSRDSTDFEAFSSPQLIIKQGWQKSSGRFQSRIVTLPGEEGVICNKSYITVHADELLLEAACLSFNSMIAVYFLQLTSGRIAAYRPEALVHELLDLPIPPLQKSVVAELETYADIDSHVFKAFALKEADQALVEDMFHYTLADFRGDDNSPGKQLTSPTSLGAADPLHAYCQYFIQVLKAGFGQDKAVIATIFQDNADPPLPYRLVAFELGGMSKSQISIKAIKTADLMRELERLDNSLGNPSTVRRGIYHQRVARIYESSSGVPTVFVVKPDMARYWSRSAGLNDADEVALDLFHWKSAAFESATQ